MKGCTQIDKGSHKESRVFVNAKGFALISTLVLMSLLVLVALSMVSLSSVTSRETRQGQAKLQAMANARLSLQVAIAQLQLSTGPDQRITATSDIRKSHTGNVNAKMTGAWRSWENLNNHLISPPSKSYDDEKEDRFLGWLISHENNQQYDLNIDPNADSSLLLAGSQSGVEDDSPVYAQKVELPEGGYAYAVLDESLKAKVNITDEAPESAPIVDALETFSASPKVDLQSIDGAFSEIGNDPEQVVKILSVNTLPLTGGTVSNQLVNQNLHALTAHSKGLLVDVNRGGFKEDLSLASESPSLPQHFSDRIEQTKYADYYPVPLDHLYQYSRLYKNLKNNGSTQDASTDSILSITSSGNKFTSYHLAPVTARIQHIFSYYATLDKDHPDPAKAIYKVSMLVTPVVTLWNPYNVEVTIKGPLSYTNRAMPLAFQLEVNGYSKNWAMYNVLMGEREYKFTIDEPEVTLQPGETRVYSSEDGSVKQWWNKNAITLKEGYRTGGGILWHRGLNFGRTDPPSLRGDAKVSIAIRPANSSDGYFTRVSSYAYFSQDGNDKNFEYLDQRFSSDDWGKCMDSFSHADTANVLVKDILSRRQIIGSASAQLKTSADCALPHLGLAHARPISYAAKVGRAWAAGGMYNQSISQSCLDMSLHAHSDYNDTFLPQISPDNSGFVGSGIRADTGLSNAVVSEIPRAPIQSLAELQHFSYSMRHYYGSSYYNVGNSLATPTLEPDSTHREPSEVDNKYADFRGDLYQDISYTANAFLFDRYFYSSIAERGGYLDKSQRESITEVYQKHLKLDEPLPNSRYLPAKGASIEDVDQPEIDCLTIASHLIVDGAFNINSTSVAAWKAQLGALRGKDVPQRSSTNGSPSISLTAPEETNPFPVSRFNIASAPSADTETPSVDQIPEAFYWKGYRTLTQAQIDTLAENIVEQIKLRGPFLSFSEFINRRLTSDPSELELARRGAIQSALEQSDCDINNFLEDSPIARDITLDDLMGEEDFEFPESATGSSAFAAPGWVTQADVLRPIAPYLTARSDTFVVRGYGETKDKKGKVIATAYCEAVVQRTLNYLIADRDADSDPSDGNHPSDGPMTNTNTPSPAMHPTNLKFGRKYEVTRFRWINPNEINQSN